MCGIAGAWGTDRAGVARMLDAIAHRGPDGHGLWTGDVTLGHRRLAVVDLETGAQPMVDAAGRFVMVYNGEIYNHLALRRELATRGVRFATRSDTETVLEAFKAWGVAAFERLEGMFALALFDTETKRLILARDRWGIKPLYWTEHEGVWMFASEQKAFGAVGRPFVVDEAALRMQAVLEFNVASLFVGIEEVMPGTFQVFEKGRLVDEATYLHRAPSIPQSPEATARSLRDALVESVQEQLMSDVPLGVVLSGGLDSATVTAIHTRLLGGKGVDTFTVAEAEDVEDYQVAARLASELDTRHHASIITYDQAVAALPSHAWHNENTNYTESFFFHLFGRMRRTVTVGLCGQGADELWGGYARYKDPASLLQLRNKRLAAVGGQAPFLASWHATGEALAKADQGAQLRNFQLRLVDRNSMAFGLEVRVPFLSRNLQRLSDASPWSFKIRGGIEKWALRKAAEDLGVPEAIAWRPKLPAGRATAPGIWQRFETEAERHVTRERRAKTPWASAAECLMEDVWRRQFAGERVASVWDAELA